MTNPIVIIPARMASTRLPGKPLADIHGEPMIVHVWRRAMEADVGPVLVAADDPAIVEAIEAVGGRAILTRADHASGSDRIFEALNAFDRRQASTTSSSTSRAICRRSKPRAVRAAVEPLDDPAVDIATLATPIARPRSATIPNVVKAVGTEIAPGRLRALYFTRARAPWGEGPLLHHIGLYAYRREALARFVALPPSPLEQREKLEQLRALEAGMRIDIALVDTPPLGVDTPRRSGARQADAGAAERKS